MALEVIGNEILPNLYIKEISVSKENISVTVAAFDYVDEEGKITWMSSDFIKKPNINLNLIMTSDGNTIDDAFDASSEYNLYQVKTSLPASPNLKFTPETCLSKELFDFSLEIKQKLEQATLQSYVEINHTFDISIRNFKTYNNINCYAFFTYDIWNEEGAVFVDSSGEDKKLLNGPICSERIISNGSIVDTTMRFTIDGTGYSGPVHIHNAKYMEGSLHTDQPHRNVSAQTVMNSKISVKDYHMLFDAKAPVVPSTNSFFTDTKIAVGNKKVYGFFRFKAQEYYSTKFDYRFFVDSFASLNILKISDNIRMKINGQPAYIKEIFINNTDTNDLHFYFEKEFNDYVETTFNIEYQILDVNNLFKPVLQKIVNEVDAYRSPIASLLSTQGARSYATVPSERIILNYIKGYCMLFSMILEMTQEDLSELKRLAISSLYKKKIPYDVLVNYDAKYSQFINVLNHRINSINNSATSIYSETRVRLIELQNYKNALCYLGGRILVHPEVITNHLTLTNGRITKMSGLFQNMEQVFVPRYVRHGNGLIEIDYNNIETNDQYLNVLQPDETETQDEEDVEIDWDTSQNETNPEQEVEDPGVEEPLEPLEQY